MPPPPPPPRASLQSFLAAARAALRAPAGQRPAPLTLVVGNESADLDSLCCAILCAYLRSHAPPHALHVPLANLPRPDLRLRPELAAVLRRAAPGLAPADLLTLCDLPADLPPAATRWLLVDHNALTGPLARFAPRVVGCLDHHADEGCVPARAVPRVIEPCGSCVSLVVDEARPVWDALSARDPRGDAELAALGLAALLVDTANLTARARVTDSDTRALAYLEAKMRPAPDAERERERAAYFHHLCAVKEDISLLSLDDVLRRDYKQWREAGLGLGVSAVPQGLGFLVDKARGAQPLLDHVAAWAAERGLDVAAVMTTSRPGGQFRRHLLVWGRRGRGSAAAAHFAERAREPLRLRPWRGGALDLGAGAADTSFAWSQGELAASRKQVAPLLREALAA